MFLGLALCFIAFVIHSCRKDIHQAASNLVNGTTVNPEIQIFKTIYDGAVRGTGLATQSNNKGFSLIRTLNVNWDSFTFQKFQDSSTVTEFEMNNDTAMFTLKKLNPNDTVKYINRTRVAFMKLKDGSRFSFFTKIIEDLTGPGSQSVIDDLYYMHIPLGFNGMVLYYSLDQQYLNGYHYTNGFIDGGVSFGSKTPQGPSTNSLEVNYASVCTTCDVYETFCSYGGPQDDPRRYVTYCTETLISSVTVCQDNGGGSGGVCSGCGSGGGSGTTNPNPCTPVSNPPVAVQSVANGRVTVHFVPIPPTGGGGTTPPPCPSAPLPLIIDQLSDECLKKALEKSRALD